MGLSNCVPGKKNSIERSGGQENPRQDRPSHAPMFARSHDEPEPNAVSGDRLRPGESRPRREAFRTLAEAREIGLSMPEALDLTPEEIRSQG